MLTFAGKDICYVDPTTDMIVIEDIARGLSRESRFNGHTSSPYFVAQHSVFCSLLVPEQFALEALLHDATEAYMKDLPTPLKRLLPMYMELEKKLDTVIRRAFQLPATMSPEVRDADANALLIEMANFTNHDIADTDIDEVYRSLRPLTPNEAHDVFMARFNTLRGN